MRFLAISAAALLTITASTAFAGDASGVWQSERNDEGKWIEVTISPCGSQVCGTISAVKGGGDPTSVGVQMIKAMVPDGPDSWDDGEIYAPDDKEWYDAKMKLTSNTTLEVSGCVAFGLICRSQVWTRLR